MFFRVLTHCSEEFTEEITHSLREDDDEYGLKAEAQTPEERQRLLELLALRMPENFSINEMMSQPPHQPVRTTLLNTKRKETPMPMRIDAQQKCELMSEPYKGRYFVYLMSHSVISKTDSHVAYSTNPIVDIICHNHRIAAPVIDRNTCMAAPFWVLDIVLGPFASLAEAIECARIWVNRTRGKEPKRDKGQYLASVFDVDMYSYRVSSDQTLEERLGSHDQGDFIPLYRDLVVPVVGVAY